MGVFTYGKVAMATSSFWLAYFVCLSLCCSLPPPTCTLPLQLLFAYEQVYLYYSVCMF